MSTNPEVTAASPSVVEISLEPLKSIKETRKILGVSEKTLRDWVWRKKIGYVKVGDRVMFEPEVVRQFIARNRVQPKPRVM